MRDPGGQQMVLVTNRDGFAGRALGHNHGPARAPCAGVSGAPRAAAVTPNTDEVTYLVLADRAAPYLLARVRWPDIAQAITVGSPDWLDDPGLFDLPYDPSAVRVSFTQATSIAAGWGRQLRDEAAEGAPSFVRRMPANWSKLVAGRAADLGRRVPWKTAPLGSARPSSAIVPSEGRRLDIGLRASERARRDAGRWQPQRGRRRLGHHHPPPRGRRSRECRNRAPAPCTGRRRGPGTHRIRSRQHFRRPRCERGRDAVCSARRDAGIRIGHDARRTVRTRSRGNHIAHLPRRGWPDQLESPHHRRHTLRRRLRCTRRRPDRRAAAIHDCRWQQRRFAMTPPPAEGDLPAVTVNGRDRPADPSAPNAAGFGRNGHDLADDRAPAVRFIAKIRLPPAGSQHRSDGLRSHGADTTGPPTAPSPPPPSHRQGGRAPRRGGARRVASPGLRGPALLVPGWRWRRRSSHVTESWSLSPVPLRARFTAARSSCSIRRSRCLAQSEAAVVATLCSASWRCLDRPSGRSTIRSSSTGSRFMSRDGSTLRTGEIGSRPIPSTTLDRTQYFVMGDYRSVACDSRLFGPISRSSIVGTAKAIVVRHGHVVLRKL